jgi:hypothetical protein
MEFDTRTILIIAAVLFILFMLSRGGTSSYENPLTQLLSDTGMMPVEKKENYQGCPSCAMK